jgi:3-phosphoshikimate 1-carboxyvinyltransferase
MTIKPTLIGSLAIPGDKSISHRALMFSALSMGQNRITGLSPAEDCRSTIRCLEQLGVHFERRVANGADSAVWLVNSPGIAALKGPRGILDAGNSGTTMRLLSGLVAGRKFESRFDGDDSLRQRPMARVLKPLQEMGAKVSFETNQGRAPFLISGGALEGKHFDLEVASAQVETAILLAGLQAEGETSVKLPVVVRDHTQRMFEFVGVPFTRKPNGETAVRRLENHLPPFQISVPGDISSCAFIMVAAACLPGSNVLLPNIGFNEGRTLIVDVLKRMGANISILERRTVCGEPVADMRIIGDQQLKGTHISGDEVAQGVDELPILALAGALCHGEFIVQGAEELRHKESDRLALICANLRSAGVDIEEFNDGFRIAGKSKLEGGSKWATKLDHRMAMTGLVGNLLAEHKLDIEETDSASISYPDFEKDLHRLLESEK